MPRKDCNLQTKVVKASKEDEKKVKIPKEKDVTSKKEKKIKSKEKAFKVEKCRTPNKKNSTKKIGNKKYKLAKKDPISDASSDEEETSSISDETTENETETETECEEENDSTTDIDQESEEEFVETQPFFVDVAQKRKKPSMKKQKSAKKLKQTEMHSSLSDIFEGWQTNCQVKTKDIDFNQWKENHSSRETFFVGPDSYIYNNASSLKKFVEILKKKQLDEKVISIPIKPMSKVVATNPRITIGVTGSRYILQNGGGYGVSPIFFIAKEYVSYIIFLCLFIINYICYYFLLQMNANNQSSSNLKQVKIQMPITALESIANSINELYKMYPTQDKKLDDIAEEED